MPSQPEPVSLSGEQVAELKQQLSVMRHDINNHLSLMMAAVELIRRRPESAERMWNTLTEQSPKITDSMAQFTRRFEATMRLRKD